MIARLAWGSIKRGKARFACAVAGMAVAVGAVVFTTSLVATNDAQAPLLAAAASRPFAGWTTAARPAGRPDLRLSTIALTVDYRPGGHVLQGPPMRALMSNAPSENQYGAVGLAEGRWVDENSAVAEVVCVRRAMSRFGAKAPELGSELKFVGKNGTMTAKIVGYLDGEKLPPQFPSVFANLAAFAKLSAEEHGSISFYRELPQGKTPDSQILTPKSEGVVAAYKSDEQRRMDYAKPLMVIAAILTALSLLVNSLLLSIEANHTELSILRTIGLTRGGVVRFVLTESFFMGFCGWVLGVAGGVGALALYACYGASFPAGIAVDFGKGAVTLAILPVIVAFAVLFALRPALRVRPLDALSRPQKPRRSGMVVTFALGFAAFVAVEVWGASLMRSFVPSPEWPDAIVSLLPGGASSFDVEKLRDIEGVRRISELLPLQVYLAPEMSARLEGHGAGRKAERPPIGQPRRPPMKPNALFLAAEWLPKFRFVEGDWESANKAINDSDAVVITEMMSRALGLHVGDSLSLDLSQPSQPPRCAQLPIAGVVDLNWHMVTSRGLVRGMNRMPPMTTGLVFASFDTVESLDRRPAFMVRMTHLWVEYEPEFLARHGVFPAGRLIEAEIARRLGNPAEATVRLHARDEIADGTLAHGTDVIGAAARVPFVFLGILAIGFIAMLVAEADAKKREFATLRAIGATRSQLAQNLVSSAIKTAFYGIMIGFPIGALSGWAASFKTAAIWPGLPHWFVVPWRIVAEGGIGAVAFALIFAVPASISLVNRLTKRKI